MKWHKKFAVKVLFAALLTLIVVSTAYAQVAVAPVGWCKIGNDPSQQSINWDGNRRGWQSDDLVYNLKTKGGHCEWDWGSSVVFTLNSVEGTVLVDGTALAYPRPNGLQLTGRTLVIDYQPNNASNGFDVWLSLTQPNVSQTPVPAQPAPVAPPTTTGPSDPWLKWIVDAITAIANKTGTTLPNMPGSNPPPAAAPTATPGPQASDPLTGSCTTADGSMSWKLDFDANKGVLFADNVLPEMRTANATQTITCEVTANVDATVSNIGQTFDLKAGEKYSYTYTVNDTSLGLSAKVK